MKNVKYFLFSLLCMVCSCVVFAKDEITIDKMIPVYDENSGVIVSEKNGIHSVVFNDKDQNVKYNIVLKNNTKRDISLSDIVLPESPEEFFKYEFVGIDENTVLEPNSTEEVVLSLETVKTEGWGRNFTLDLTSKVEIMDNVVNPNTSAQELIVLFVSITFITGIVTIWLKNRKVSRYVVLVVMFWSIISVTNAKDPIILPIKLNVSYESQNVMSKSYMIEEYCDSWEYDGEEYKECWQNYKQIYFWQFRDEIKNIYFEYELKEFSDYVYKFDVSEAQNEKVIAYLVENKDDSDMFDLHIQADGLIIPNQDVKYYFSMGYLEKINNLENLDTAVLTDMSYMFYNTGAFVEEEFKLDLNNFDTSNVTNMSSMFSRVGANSTNLNLDLSLLDTSNVTDMSSMFSGVGSNSTNLNLDLSLLDTSNVTDMSSMFLETGFSSETITLDLSNFDTSNVTDMSSMFDSLGRYSDSVELVIDNFDTSNVTDMSHMFSGTGYNSTNLMLDVSNFDTSKVTDMSYMFSNMGINMSNFNFNLNFDTSNVTDMSYMFNGVAMNGEDIQINFGDKFNTSNVTNMSCMFRNIARYDPNFMLDLSSFDTSNVTDMSAMFSDLGINTERFVLDISNFDTSKVTDMSSMFSGTGKNSYEYELILGDNFNTSKVTDMTHMFSQIGYNSQNIILDLSGFDTSNVTDMKYMFFQTGYNSSDFNLNLNNFNTSNVTNMESMFFETAYNNPNFTLDISNFDTTEVTTMHQMFCGVGYKSTKLNITITIKNRTVLNYYNMFKNVATKSGSKITVNYTSETEALVDKMIATKTAGANIVKGVQVD